MTKTMDLKLATDLSVLMAHSHLVQARVLQAASEGALSSHVREQLAKSVCVMADRIEGNPT
jgi:hypothetical protein